MEKCCQHCRFWKVETIKYGSCQHPITNMMRSAVNYAFVPFAFKHVEVTMVKRDGGIECNAYVEVEP